MPERARKVLAEGRQMRILAEMGSKVLVMHLDLANKGQIILVGDRNVIYDVNMV